MNEKDLGILSVPRNEFMFRMFLQMGLVEQADSGIRRMRELCRDRNIAEPQIEIRDHAVIIIFQRPFALPAPLQTDHADTNKKMTMLMMPEHFF